MAQKLNHYRVVVQKHDGVLVTYDESAVFIEVVIRHAPFTASPETWMPSAELLHNKLALMKPRAANPFVPRCYETNRRCVGCERQWSGDVLFSQATSSRRFLRAL